MHAAIKTLENELMIKRLQARELERSDAAPERLAALNETIRSLERGLKALYVAAGETHGQRREGAASPYIESPKSKIGNRKSEILQ